MLAHGTLGDDGYIDGMHDVAFVDGLALVRQSSVVIPCRTTMSAFHADAYVDDDVGDGDSLSVVMTEILPLSALDDAMLVDRLLCGSMLGKARWRRPQSGVRSVPGCKRRPAI